MYCVSVWASTYPTNLNRIIILQKRLVCIISNQSFDAQTAPLFRELKILRFTDIFLFQLGKFMYLFKLGLLPEILNELFFTNNQMHSYNTRKSNAFHIFPCRTNLRRFAIRLCSYCYFYSLYNILKDQLYRISRSEFYEWLFGPEKFSGLSRNGSLARVARSVVRANQP